MSREREAHRLTVNLILPAGVNTGVTGQEKELVMERVISMCLNEFCIL